MGTPMRKPLYGRFRKKVEKIDTEKGIVRAAGIAWLSFIFGCAGAFGPGGFFIGFGMGLAMIAAVAAICEIILHVSRVS